MVNISTDQSYIKGALAQVNQAKTPPEMRTSRRAVSPRASEPTDVASISTQALKPQAINLHPEAPEVDENTFALAQPGGNFTTLFTLLDGNRNAQTLVKQAAKEQELVGVG